MSRLPVEMEITGGMSPRQKIWLAIRKHKDSFTQSMLSEKSKVSESIVKDYVSALQKAGFIAVIDSEVVRAVCKRFTYQLVKDNGVEAPRVTKKGELVTQGSVNEAMWGTLRRVLKGKSFDYRELASFASTSKHVVHEITAKQYVLMLAQAGYFDIVAPAVQGKRARPARYQLKAKMDTGSRAPMVQRTKQVYDPNTNKVMWVEPKGDEDEIL